MAYVPDLTTETGLRLYLQTHNHPKHLSISLLSGGTANYVYRISFPHSPPSIFKHAAPYLHSNKNFAFDPTRMDYEANALSIFSSTHGNSPLAKYVPDSAVHAVKLFSYDKEAKLLGIEDGGDRNLKDAYDDTKLDVAQIGKELAEWIAALHACSRDVSLALPGDDAGLKGGKNNLIAVNIYRHSYSNLHHALSKFGHDPRLAERIDHEFGSLLATDNECVCHGDFWPGNVLVRLPDSDGGSTNLTIVDWEMVRRGTSATDIGQFAAEAFLLNRFRGGRGLLPAFLNAYVAAREKIADGARTLDKEWVRRMVVHWAVHVAFWPTRVVWTDREGTQQLVDIGVKVLKDVLEGDWEGVLESPLLRDVKGAWAPVLVNRR